MMFGKSAANVPAAMSFGKIFDQPFNTYSPVLAKRATKGKNRKPHRMIDRRTFLTATAAGTATLAVAKRFPFRPALGVSMASYAIRNRFGANVNHKALNNLFSGTAGGPGTR